jgi:hypothetical protein
MHLVDMLVNRLANREENRMELLTAREYTSRFKLPQENPAFRNKTSRPSVTTQLYERFDNWRDDYEKSVFIPDCSCYGGGDGAAVRADFISGER